MSQMRRGPTRYVILCIKRLLIDWLIDEMENKWVFKCALKTVNDSAVSRRLNGSSFHARGPAAAKDRSPNVLFWRGTEQTRRSANVVNDDVVVCCTGKGFHAFIFRHWAVGERIRWDCCVAGATRHPRLPSRLHATATASWSVLINPSRWGCEAELAWMAGYAHGTIHSERYTNRD